MVMSLTAALNLLIGSLGLRLSAALLDVMRQTLRDAFGRGLALSAWLLLALLPLSQSVAAMEIEFAGRVINRDILVLYDKRQEGPLIESRVHRYAEMPLNHLGYMLTYLDVNEPLPHVHSLQKYRGIITWFNEPLKKPAQVAQWIDEAVATGLRHVVLGSIAPPATAATVPAIGRILARLGLKDSGGFVTLTYKARVIKADPKFIGFERRIDKVIPEFAAFLAASNSLRGHVVINVPIDGIDKNVVAVATNSNGGYAAHNFTFFYEKNTNRVRWVLNPFAFFRSAFGDERFPIPDTTTLDGNRIYFSHIDGDGWNNLTEIQEYRREGLLSAEVILRDVIEAYPDLPVSVGLLAGDIDISLGGNPKGAPIARRMFTLPQVEVASHTHTHPYDWQFFGDYSRAEEEEMINRFQRPNTPLRKRFTAAMLRLANKRVPADQFNKYVAGTDDLPRTYLKDPFHLKHEVEGALDVLRKLVPPGRKPMLYQWSGNTTPFAAAIAATRAAGVRNINGGDSRFDWEFPSVAYIPAISRVTGGERQIYAVNSNENTYTNDWTGPYFGFFMLKHTLANTDQPRRLKAFNLYYHMYSGEKASALASVKYFLDMARKAAVTPITASHYAAIADDYFNVTIEQVGLSSWAVKNRGFMQTMRFDDAEGVDIDAVRSIGVLGVSRHQGSLYVALDDDVERAVITLKPAGGRKPEVEAGTAAGTAAGARTRVAGGSGAQPRRLYLVNSRWHLSQLAEESCGLTVKAQGFGPGDMLWRAAPGQGFLITANRNGKLMFEETRWADRDGLLKLRIKGKALEPLELRFSCHE